MFLKQFTAFSQLELRVVETHCAASAKKSKALCIPTDKVVLAVGKHERFNYCSGDPRQSKKECKKLWESMVDKLLCKMTTRLRSSLQ